MSGVDIAVQSMGFRKAEEDERCRKEEAENGRSGEDSSRDE